MYTDHTKKARCIMQVCSKSHNPESVVPDAMYVFCRLPDGLDGTALAQNRASGIIPGRSFFNIDAYESLRAQIST